MSFELLRDGQDMLTKHIFPISAVIGSLHGCSGLREAEDVIHCHVLASINGRAYRSFSLHRRRSQFVDQITASEPEAWFQFSCQGVNQHLHLDLTDSASVRGARTTGRWVGLLMGIGGSWKVFSHMAYQPTGVPLIPGYVNSKVEAAVT